MKKSPLNKTVKKVNNNIKIAIKDEKQLKYLKVTILTLPRIYGIPKIHWVETNYKCNQLIGTQLRRIYSINT